MFLFVVCILILYIWGGNSQNITSITKDKTAVLKSLMAIFIVLHHLSLQGITFLQMFHSWGAPIVSIFLFLSGYGLMKSLELKGSKYLSTFFVNRIIKGLVVPFLITWGIYRLLNIRGLPNIFNELEDLVNHGITILPHSWFVFAILYFYLSFYVSYKCIRKRFSYLVLILAIVLYEFWCNYWGYDRCWYISSLGFPTGILFCKYENNIVKYLKGPINYYFIIPICLIIIALLVYMKIEITYMFVYILIPFIFAIILLKVNIGEFIKFKSVMFLSKISFEIYLSQGISMCIFRGNFLNLRSDFLYVVLVLVFTIIIAVIIKFIKDSLLRCCSNFNL